MIGRVIVSLVLSAVASGAWAQTPPRAEVPIREVILSDGARRYAVPITIGATVLQAGLDTGSTGLRVLPGVLGDGDARPTAHGDTYQYGAGAKLDGVRAEATVAVGGLAGATSLQLVRKVGCDPDKPRCAAGTLPLARYGIQGDGLPGEGFKAILGVNMAESDVASLFQGIGARRWIIELPRPGETAPGRIVLNPTDDEVADYVRVPLAPGLSGLRGGLHDAMNGCLVNTASHARVCGAVLLDTGAPGIRVVTADPPGAPWPDGATADLVFADGDGQVKAAERLTLGLRAQASRLAFERQAGPVPVRIFAGLTPYFAFSVLYDPEHAAIGLKPRPPAPGGPQAIR